MSSNAPRQLRASEPAGPLRAPAADVDTGLAQSAGSTLPAWSDSPRQLKQGAQLAQLQAAEASATPAQGGLPQGLRQGIESLSGLDMSGVRVHRNSSKPAALQAHAYAQGQDIHLGPGQEKHLPHEAWHVVQQAQGRVRPTVQMKQGRVAVNDDAGLEREADIRGAQALQHKTITTQRRPKTGSLTGDSQNLLLSTQASSESVAQLNPMNKMRQGFGKASSSIGVATAAVLLASNPLGWGVGAAMLGGLLATAGSSYLLSPADPEAITVKGSFIDGAIQWDYSYDVAFAFPTATIHLDFYIAGGRVSELDRQSYVERLKDKVSEVFDNKIRIELNDTRYDTIVSVNVAFDDNQARINFDESVPIRKLSLHDTLGRSDALNLHVASDSSGYVGAHEVGHHLGLVDEYSDLDLSPHRRVFHDNGIMTGPPTNPILPQRNIEKIKNEIEHAVEERTRRQRREEQYANDARNGSLPI
ncbi:DUF4157 domain-containing protein [Roseateles sp.]|uniref:eCIS core domain-containing protein n=1 Tax=Roseateles sp. TaxID=1971397 RepID=UPI003D0B5B67